MLIVVEFGLSALPLECRENLIHCEAHIAHQVFFVVGDVPCRASEGMEEEKDNVEGQGRRGAKIILGS